MGFSFFNKRRSSAFLSIEYILNILEIRFTKSNLKTLLEEHVDYPSFWTVSEALRKFGISSAAVKKNKYEYIDFEIPFICAIQKKDWGDPEFTVVTCVGEDEITYLDPHKNILITNSLKEFESIDKEVILLIDGTEKVDEIDFVKNEKRERIYKMTSHIPIYFLLIFFSSCIIFQGLNLDQFFLLRFGLSMTSTIGFVLSLIIIWHEIDSQNPFIREICGGFGQGVNCDAVLLSKGAKLLGISWSVIGGSYFFFLFTSLLIFNKQISIFYFWEITSFLASFYIVYSIYYQWKVVKQWCVMCLGIQLVLLVNLFLYIIFNIFGGALAFHWLDTILLISYGALIFVLFSYVIPIIKTAHNSKEYEKRWKRLRYDPTVFDSLLNKSATISFPVSDLGVIIGNPEAELEIIKVCNPYCNPCSRAHLILDRIVKNSNNIKVRIIFTASGELNDKATFPVAHILDLYEKSDKEKLTMALDAWYLDQDKNYDSFASRFPINEDFKLQIEKVKKMNSWCNKMKIRATPTIFVNGRELPEGYKVDDLEEIL
ncbi:vitamin K epoxide reductase family protein [Sphingobacterium sp. HMA12]|uniref:vitamin K epoxide reductase family protein n=1 Tax=Sphingobacterium sp. HMA12 TaxID=2050894 RepID=UPI000CEA2189|nr:vitamin K epoxide reductase family protein [Sphingobacterium sp. HMA12]